MNKKILLILIIPFVVAGCSLSSKPQAKQEQKPSQNAGKLDLRVADIYYEKGRVKVQYCNDGISDLAKKTFELKIEAPNIKTYQDVPYQIPDQGECIDTFGIPVEDFGLLFNNGSTVEFTVTADKNNTLNELDKSNNILVKEITLSELNAPHIFPPRLDSATQTTADVSWKTDIPASTECRLFQAEPKGSTNINSELDCSYFGVDNSSALVTEHAISFKKFQPGSIYYLMIRARDQEGRVTDSVLYPILTQTAE